MSVSEISSRIPQNVLSCQYSLLLSDLKQLSSLVLLPSVPFSANNIPSFSSTPPNDSSLLAEILVIFANSLFLDSSTTTTTSTFVQNDGLPLISHCLSNVSLLSSTDSTVHFDPEFGSSSALKELFKAIFLLSNNYEISFRSSSSFLNSSDDFLFGNYISQDHFSPFKSSLEAVLGSMVYISSLPDSFDLYHFALQALFNFPVPPPGSPIYDIWFPSSNQFIHLNSILSYLKSRVSTYTFNDSVNSIDLSPEQQANEFPLFCILARLSIANSLAKKHAFDFIFANRDYSVLPEIGNSISAIVTRIIRAPMQSNFTLLVGDFIYLICDSNSSIFVTQIGFGNAAGYLNARNLPLNTITELPDSSTASNIPHSDPTNPITGSTFSPQHSTQTEKDLADMSDSEKEREAERLFVLFDRLNKNGIFKVQPQFDNPN
ncbi:Synembryn-A [Smittium mucronatum]|uniref:Synembryn-A n=1 Tax=Smittium mucronatum TaxID=133383 RepID=A0A1R0H1I6_9FUNG|nr:Synembryn-A [Smittium mucronatum]